MRYTYTAAKPTLASNLLAQPSFTSAPQFSGPRDNVTSFDIIGAQDIDFADRFNELAVTEYVEEIYTNLKRKEMELAAPTDYMTQQVRYHTQHIHGCV
jgi:hypothetical protein